MAANARQLTQRLQGLTKRQGAALAMAHKATGTAADIGKQIETTQAELLTLMGSKDNGASSKAPNKAKAAPSKAHATKPPSTTGEQNS